MARIEEFLQMNHDQLEEAVAKERAKIKRARTNIALLEKLKIATQRVKENDEHRNKGNAANANVGGFQKQ